MGFCQKRTVTALKEMETTLRGLRQTPTFQT